MRATGPTSTIESMWGAFDIVPSADPLAHATRGIWVGGQGGNLHVRMNTGEEVTFTGVVPGMIHRLAVTHIFVAGTTATDIIGLY